LRGNVIAGGDDMGGVAANRLTSGISGVAGTIGSAGGDQRMQSHTHTISINDPTHFHSYTTVGSSGAAGGSPNLQSGSTGANTAASGTGITATATSTGAGASQNVQPTAVLYFILKT
jgi:hypothetical protein